MPGILDTLKGRLAQHNANDPPAWSAAPEPIHALGRYRDVPEAEYEAGEDFCARHPVSSPKLLSSSAVEQIRSLGAKAWEMQVPTTPRFRGTISRTEYGTTLIRTQRECRETTILSNLPIMGGLYDVPREMEGVYFEITVNRMEGVVAIGTACRPYPEFRFPGWNRQSAGFHLDDMRKFFEDPDGGRDYMAEEKLKSGDVIGCGYEFGRAVIFFTYNGERLPDAFTGVYLSRAAWDVYAAIGVCGESEVEVNFGCRGFTWKMGESWAVERHVGGPIATTSIQ